MTQHSHDADAHGTDGRGTGQAGTAPVAASTAAMSREGHNANPPAAPPAPPSAARIFGPRLAMAEAFAAILADTGVAHGLIGPREVSILWERHVLNCAVVSEAFPESAELVDVGSGAGLPGLALAIARPDLRVHLVEPMLRRTNWLADTVAALGLDGVEVHRGRAEEFHGRLTVPFATARAVARIDKLARWTFPLLQDGGTLVALKGSQAAEELEAEEPVLRRLGLATARVHAYGAQALDVPTVTIELTVGARTAPRRASRATSRSASRRLPG